MPKKGKNMKYNHGEKSMKALFSFYADMDSLLEKIDACHSSAKTKINKHAASGYSLFTYCSFDARKRAQLL